MTERKKNRISRPVFLTLRETVFDMLCALEGQRLDVVLIPSSVPDVAARGGKIRAVQESNAEWYQHFCRSHQSSRRRNRHNDNDTKIKRSHTIAALERMMRGSFDSIYAQRLLKFINQSRLQRTRAAQPHARLVYVAQGYDQQSAV